MPNANRRTTNDSGKDGTKPRQFFLRRRIIGRQPPRLFPRGRRLIVAAANAKGIAQVEVRSGIVRPMYNFDAQDQSFAWLAARRGIGVELTHVTGGHHDLRDIERAEPPAYVWLGRHVLPPVGAQAVN